MMGNVRYLATKYPDAPDIWGYLRFVTGQSSLEALNAAFGGTPLPPKTWFKPLTYVSQKAEVEP
jgi:hypothetical protein